MTEPNDAPRGPDGSTLTPQEWDAVRRLRGEPAAAPVAEPAAGPATQSAAEPVTAAAPAEEDPFDTPLVAAEEPAAGAPGRPAPGSGANGRALLPALAVLVVLAVVAVALLAVVTARLSERHEHRSNATAALAAATSGVATVLTYNYKTLSQDFARAEALLTPSFRKSYENTTAKAVEPLAAKYHAVSTAQVSSGGVISNSGSRAQVLVFVAQQETNTQLSAPRLDRSRIVVDLKRTNGRWLIDKLNPV